MATRKEQAAETRDAILGATILVMQERGFPATRIADVASLAGVSTGLVLYHFGSRDKLLAAAFLFSEAQFLNLAKETAASDRSPREKLRLFVGLAFEEADEFDLTNSWLLWLDMWQQALRNDSIRTARKQLDECWRGVIADAVREGQAAGVFGPSDPEVFARMLSALQDGLAVAIVLGDEGLSNAQARRMCLQLCDHELGTNYL